MFKYLPCAIFELEYVTHWWQLNVAENRGYLPYTVKKLNDFPVPSRDVTNQTGIIKLFPPRESLVSDIPAGDGKMANLFSQCTRNERAVFGNLKI